MAKKEKQQQNQLFNIEELVNNIAQDIVKFSEDVAKVKVTRDLKSLDLSSGMPKARTTALKGIVGQLKAEGEKVSQQQREQIQIQSEALEESIKSRQANLKINLSKLQKAEAKVSGSSKIVEMKVDEDIKSYDRHIEELHIQKTGSPENIWIEADISAEIKTTTAEKVTGALTESKVTKNIKTTDLNK